MKKNILRNLINLFLIKKKIIIIWLIIEKTDELREWGGKWEGVRERERVSQSQSLKIFKPT